MFCYHQNPSIPLYPILYLTFLKINMVRYQSFILLHISLESLSGVSDFKIPIMLSPKRRLSSSLAHEFISLKVNLDFCFQIKYFFLYILLKSQGLSLYDCPTYIRLTSKPQEMMIHELVVKVAQNGSQTRMSLYSACKYGKWIRRAHLVPVHEIHYKQLNICN